MIRLKTKIKNTNAACYALCVTANRPPKLESYRSADVAQSYDKRWSGLVGARRDARKVRALTHALAALAKLGKSNEQTSAGGNHQNSAEICTLLDAPCGTGRFSKWLTAAYTYTGLDLSPAMLAEAQAKAPAAHFMTGDMASLPFADHAFDAAICIRLLHLVREPKLRIQFLRELNRVSTHGVIIDYRHRHTFRIWGRHLRHKLGLRDRAPSNPSMAQIHDEINAAGLTARKLIHVHRAPFLSDKVLIVATR
jgi:SAM-dependent methyltransferase